MSQSKLNVRSLLDKLIDIEQSIGIETDAALRDKVREAQDIILQVQQSNRNMHADTIDPF